MKETEYELFLNCIPFMFMNQPQKYLISNFLWSGQDNIEFLVIHLRLYDLVRRLYYVKIKEEPSRETILKAIKNILKSNHLKNYFRKYILTGQFPIYPDKVEITNT